MKLSEAQWMRSGGDGAEWRFVLAKRRDAAASELKAVRVLLARDCPKSLKSLGLPAAIDGLLKASSNHRDPLLLFPAMDCWLSLSRTFLAGPRPLKEWEIHFPLFLGFAGALAAARKERRKISVRLGPTGRFHLTGSRIYFDAGQDQAGKPAMLEIEGGNANLKAAGGLAAKGILSAVTPTMWVEHRDPLILQPIRVQAADSPSQTDEARFTEVLSGAMKNLARHDHGLYEEMNSFLRVLIPLKNPENRGSVSSSYQNMRGAFCLSHAEDSLLQEETLIHEFCHQKANLLGELDPLIEPGQSAQIYFSPLRPDARRLRGLLLGAHAFLNINAYLLRVRRREEISVSDEDALVRNVARRLFHCEEMLRAVSGYALMTEFGGRCLMFLWRELMRQFHEAESFPRAVLDEGRKAVAAQREDHALGATSLHRMPGLDAKAAVEKAKKTK